MANIFQVAVYKVQTICTEWRKRGQFIIIALATPWRSVINKFKYINKTKR